MSSQITGRPVNRLFIFLSNGEDYEDRVIFAENNLDFVKKYCELPNGIPSHDTFNRIFSHLKTSILEGIMKDYGYRIIDVLSEKQICIDGKKLRGANPASKGNQGVYIVNAWVAENQLFIAQKRVEDKSNELTAIPQILSQIEIENATVSMDALGCQKEIAKEITTRKGHCFLSVKNNQSELHDDISCAFKASTSAGTAEEWECQNNRFETGKCCILSAETSLLSETSEPWTGLKTIVKSYPGDKLSVKKRRLKAGYNIGYLEKLISCV